jgi:hypothetical protein
LNLKMPDAVRIEFKDLVDRGRPVLEDVLSRLPALASAASNRGATWHPTGFVVLNLLDVEGLGLVRLHIWSRSQRQKRVGNPEVHVHVFHLTSYVLMGTYTEHQYVQHVTGDGDLSGYAVVPPNGDGVDRLVADGSRYSLELIKTESTTEGAYHHLPAGVYHMTDNPEGATCATVALLSRPQPGQTDHLIGPESHGGLASKRERVETHTLAEVLEEIGLGPLQVRE